MIVEFFGAPGGGKTWLMRELLSTMPDAEEVAVRPRAAVARGVVFFVLRHPLSFLAWLIELVFHANGLFRYKLGLLLRTMSALAHAERIDSSRIIFIDEGFLQRVLTIFDTPLTPRHVKFLLRMTPLPSVVISVSGGTFGRFTDAHNRHNSPRVKKGEERLQAWMRNVVTNTVSIESLVPERVLIIRYDRNQPEIGPAAVRQRIEEMRACDIIRQS